MFDLTGSDFEIASLHQCSLTSSAGFLLLSSQQAQLVDFI